MKTAVCIASGPSLTKEDVEYCRGKARVYAVKECRHLAPWADVLYAADSDWWDKFDGCRDFAGERWTLDADTAKKYGINHINYDTKIRWSLTPGLIASNGNSGSQAMNLAALDLAKDGLDGTEKIILLGFDFGFQPGQDKHWWEKDHPRNSRDSNYKDWIKFLNIAAPQIPVKVYNASRQTALECFERVALRDVL